MNGWDRVIRPQQAIGTIVAFNGLLRAVAWWIDHDLAKRAVPAEVRNMHRQGL